MAKGMQEAGRIGVLKTRRNNITTIYVLPGLIGAPLYPQKHAAGVFDVFFDGQWIRTGLEGAFNCFYHLILKKAAFNNIKNVIINYLRERYESYKFGMVSFFFKDKTLIIAIKP